MKKYAILFGLFLFFAGYSADAQTGNCTQKIINTTNYPNATASLSNGGDATALLSASTTDYVLPASPNSNYASIKIGQIMPASSIFGVAFALGGGYSMGIGTYLGGILQEGFSPTFNGRNLVTQTFTATKSFDEIRVSYIVLMTLVAIDPPAVPEQLYYVYINDCGSSTNNTCTQKQVNITNYPNATAKRYGFFAGGVPYVLAPNLVSPSTTDYESIGDNSSINDDESYITLDLGETIAAGKGQIDIDAIIGDVKGLLKISTALNGVARESLLITYSSNATTGRLIGDFTTTKSYNQLTITCYAPIGGTANTQVLVNIYSIATCNVTLCATRKEVNTTNYPTAVANRPANPLMASPSMPLAPNVLTPNTQPLNTATADYELLSHRNAQDFIDGITITLGKTIQANAVNNFEFTGNSLGLKITTYLNNVLQETPAITYPPVIALAGTPSVGLFSTEKAYDKINITYDAIANEVVGIVREAKIYDFNVGDCGVINCLLPTSPPVVTASGSQICNNTSVTLTASGCTGTVIWSNGLTGTTLTVSTAGTYSAICTTSCGTSPQSNLVIITGCTDSCTPKEINTTNFPKASAYYGYYITIPANVAPLNPQAILTPTVEPFNAATADFVDVCSPNYLTVKMGTTLSAGKISVKATATLETGVVGVLYTYFNGVMQETLSQAINNTPSLLEFIATKSFDEIRINALPPPLIGWGSCSRIYSIAVCGKESSTCIDPTKINPVGSCITLYAPVCGCNNITYSNSCEADKAGVKSYTVGACTTTGGGFKDFNPTNFPNAKAEGHNMYGTFDATPLLNNPNEISLNAYTTKSLANYGKVVVQLGTQYQAGSTGGFTLSASTPPLKIIEISTHLSGTPPFYAQKATYTADATGKYTFTTGNIFDEVQVLFVYPESSTAPTVPAKLQKFFMN